jgi:hypothetical protein
VSGTYYPSARTLWTLSNSGLGQTLTASGNSGTVPISLMDVTDVWLAVFVNGIATGTTPTLQVQLDVQDPDGNWFAQVAKTAQLTTTPNYSSISAGLHIASTGSMVLPQFCRVAWTLGGTTPMYPQTSISLIGR